MFLQYRTLRILNYETDQDFLNNQKAIYNTPPFTIILINIIESTSVNRMVIIPRFSLDSIDLLESTPNYKLSNNSVSNSYNLQLVQNSETITLYGASDLIGTASIPNLMNHLIFTYNRLSQILQSGDRNQVMLNISLFATQNSVEKQIIHSNFTDPSKWELGLTSTGTCTIYNFTSHTGPLQVGEIRSLDVNGDPTHNWSDVVSIEVHQSTLQNRINLNLLQVAQYQKYTIRNILNENTTDYGLVAFQVQNVSINGDSYLIELLGNAINLNSHPWTDSTVALDLIGQLIQDMGNILIDNPQTDQVLTFDGSVWINADGGGGAVALPNNQIGYGDGVGIISSQELQVDTTDKVLQLGSNVTSGGISYYVDGSNCFNMVQQPNGAIVQQPSHTDDRSQLYIETPDDPLNEPPRLKVNDNIVSYLSDNNLCFKLAGQTANEGLSEFIVGSTFDPTPLKLVVNNKTKFQASEIDTFIGNEVETNSINISAKDNLNISGANAGNTQFNIYDIKNVVVHPTEKTQLYGDTQGVIIDINDGAPNSNLYYNSTGLTVTQISERIRDDLNANIVPTRKYVEDLINVENQFLVNMNGNDTTGLGLTEISIGSNESIPVQILEAGAVVANFKNDNVLIQSTDQMNIECQGTLNFLGSSATPSIISFGDEDIGKPIKQVFINALERFGIQGFSQGIEIFPNGSGDTNLIFYNTSTGISSNVLVNRIKSANLNVFDPLTTRGYVDKNLGGRNLNAITVPLNNQSYRYDSTTLTFVPKSFYQPFGEIFIEQLNTSTNTVLAVQNTWYKLSLTNLTTFSSNNSQIGINLFDSIVNREIRYIGSNTLNCNVSLSFSCSLADTGETYQFGLSKATIAPFDPIIGTVNNFSINTNNVFDLFSTSKNMDLTPNDSLFLVMRFTSVDSNRNVFLRNLNIRIVSTEIF